jgi:hypothetical protein
MFVLLTVVLHWRLRSLLREYQSETLPEAFGLSVRKRMEISASMTFRYQNIRNFEEMLIFRLLPAVRCRGGAGIITRKNVMNIVCNMS